MSGNGARSECQTEEKAQLAKVLAARLDVLCSIPATGVVGGENQLSHIFSDLHTCPMVCLTPYINAHRQKEENAQWPELLAGAAGVCRGRTWTRAA